MYIGRFKIPKKNIKILRNSYEKLYLKSRYPELLRQQADVILERVVDEKFLEAYYKAEKDNPNFSEEDDAEFLVEIKKLMVKWKSKIESNLNRKW
jgi:hypothetical protein